MNNNPQNTALWALLLLAAAAGTAALYSRSFYQWVVPAYGAALALLFLTAAAGAALFALKKLFVDPDNGDYTLRDDAPVFDEIPDFEPLPLSKIGRY